MVQSLTGRHSVPADLPPGGSLTSSLSDQINRSGDDDMMETIVDDMEGVQSWSAPPTRAVLFSPVTSCDESQTFDELDKLPKKIMEFSSSSSDFFSSPPVSQRFEPYDGLWHGGDNSWFSSHVPQQQGTSCTYKLDG
ncbi:hypothetical protein RchiOBHm_Chr7g0235351 [Rosa chinensis]|uniref:Uncharacterized protein n=1 Tax=Rosa chinensis TaxID=74649 RepID=A0A2P6PGN2_ROSCH|nr:hypothetical protein RchiOBHm_Chr7g0235351 [Rosa chinensis]